MSHRRDLQPRLPVAIVASQKAVLLDAENPNGRAYMGMALLFLGKINGAEAPLDQAILLNPLADEPVEADGNDRGPNPYELLLMALGACTAMTIRLYVERKKWPLTRIAVRLRHERIYARDCADCETKEGMLDEIERVIEIEGPLDAEQKRRILEIADKCPVHRTLTSEIKIRSRLA